MVSNKELKTRLLQQPEIREEYDRLDPEHELVRELITARARAGLTQAEVAERMGTTQSTIARLESGKSPSMKTLQRFALATGAKLKIRLEEDRQETGMGEPEPPVLAKTKEVIEKLKKRLNVQPGNWAKVRALLAKQAGGQIDSMPQWELLILATAEGSPMAAEIPTPARRIDQVEKIIEHASALKQLINPKGNDDFWLSALSRAWPTEEASTESPPSKTVQLEQKYQTRTRLAEVILGLETAARQSSQTLHKQKARRLRANKPDLQQLARNLVQAAQSGLLPFDVSELTRTPFCNLVDATCQIARLKPPGDTKKMVARILADFENQGT